MPMTNSSITRGVGEQTRSGRGGKGSRAELLEGVLSFAAL